jgi:4-hydroxy-tetrahydrodipicolinate reductase
MEKIKIMINGIPGNVAAQMAGKAMTDNRFDVLPASLTGPEIEAADHTVGSTPVQLLKPDSRDKAVEALKKDHGSFIAIDYTHPSAVNQNAEFYARHDIPFVMGTTGGDRERLFQTVKSASISAVIAPNMVKQIVGFQSMMAYAASTFPGLFKGYTLEIKESHQQGKADTSGTAKAMVGYYNELGIPFTPEEIQKERDPETQRNEWKIPEPFLSGHAWHTYTLTSTDNSVQFEFKHNINGRDVYIEGTLDAARFLDRQIKNGSSGNVFSMIDVLKAGA